jgi:glycosyltransferase involved in cell wall biosynthesis
MSEYQRADFSAPYLQVKTIKIPHGIPSLGGRLRSRIQQESAAVLYFSNFEDEKGWRVLLEAAVEICSVRNDVRFDLYGNSGRAASLSAIQRCVDDAGFHNQVKYHGPAYGGAKRDAFVNADIFCFPTFGPETFGIVNLEAMSCGLPIVATNNAATAEIVIDGRGGLLVRPRDSRSLAKAILKLADDPNLREEMGRFNYARFGEQYSLDRFVANWTELFRHEGSGEK